MNRYTLGAALGATCLILAACGAKTDTADANNEAAIDANGAVAADTGATATAGFPKGARIVEEKGVTYRVDADGTRVALGPNDSKIVVVDGDRYRQDPDGTRVKIKDDGLSIDLPDIDLPDVDVGTSKKGNLDIDVGDKDPDGGR